VQVGGVEMQQPCILSAGLTWADDFAVHELELSITWQTDYITGDCMRAAAAVAARVTAAAVAAVTRLATVAAALMQCLIDVLCLPG